MRNYTDNESRKNEYYHRFDMHLVVRVYSESTHALIALVRRMRVQVRKQAQMIRKVRPVCIKHTCDEITTNIAWKVKVTNKRTKLINIVTAKPRLTYLAINKTTKMAAKHYRVTAIFIQSIREHTKLIHSQ